MAIVAGSLAVLLAVGTASQATELPFFGKESSAQDAPGDGAFVFYFSAGAVDGAP